MLLLMKKLPLNFLQRRKEDGNLTLTKVKGTLLEDVSELIPAHYRFLKPASENFKIPLAAKQEKLVTLRKCLVESNREFSLHLQTIDEKPSGGDDGSSCSNERAQIRKETVHPDLEFDEPVPRKMPKQTTIESAFKIRKDRPLDPLDAARGRVHLCSSRYIERLVMVAKNTTHFGTPKHKNCALTGTSMVTKNKSYMVL